MKAKVFTKPRYNGIEFDSNEEVEFYQWLEEAKEAKLISDFKFHPKTFTLAPAAVFHVRQQLPTKTKIVSRHLLQDCCYTPDFMFTATPDLQRVDHRLFSPDNTEYWIDVKGKFSIHNDEAKFSVIKKWMYQRYEIFINKVIPVEFFEKTFVPRQATRTKQTGKLRSCYVHCRKVYEVPRERRFMNLDIVPAPDVSPVIEQDLFQSKPSFNF